MLLRDGAPEPRRGRISVGELALHTNNLLVLRGPKAAREPLPGAGQSFLACLNQDWTTRSEKKRKDGEVNCRGEEGNETDR